MIITAMSDIHGTLVDVEKTDLLLIAGDWSPLEIQCDLNYMKEFLDDVFIPYLLSIDADKIILVAGNHDFICDPMFLNYNIFYKNLLSDSCRFIDFKKDILMPILRKHKALNKIKYLENTYTNYKGLRIYGSPYVEGCAGWAFSMVNRGDQFRYIPKCDILVTHQPPAYKRIGSSFIEGKDIDFGSYSLLESIIKVKPKYVFCGHIHGGDHNEQVYVHLDESRTVMYNCSIKNEDYNVAHSPLTIIYGGRENSQAKVCWVEADK